MIRVMASQKREFVFFMLMVAVSVAAADVLSASDAGSTLIMALGAIACLVAFLNAEIAIYFLIAAMLLSPEVTIGSTGPGASLGRPVTLRVDDFLIVIICTTWFLKSVLSKEISLLKHTPLNKAMFLYAFGALFSTMLGMIGGQVDPKTGSLFVLKYVEYFMIFWMVVNTVQEEGQVRRFLLVLFLVALVVSISAIMQIPEGQRVTAPFEGDEGEPNTLGGYLLFIAALLGGIAISHASYRWPAIALLIPVMIAFAYTLSRASYIGLIPVAFLLPVLLRRLYMLVATLVFAMLLILFPQQLLPQAAYERINFTFNQDVNTRARQVRLFGTRVDTSTSARLLYMEAAIEAFMEKPIFGWGVTGWRFLDSQYFRTLSETGLFGLSTFLLLIYTVLKVAFQNLRMVTHRDPLYPGLTAGFIAGTFGLLAHAIGSNTFIIVRIMEPFWLCCALVYLLPQVTPPEPMNVVPV